MYQHRRSRLLRGVNNGHEGLRAAHLITDPHPGASVVVGIGARVTLRFTTPLQGAWRVEERPSHLALVERRAHELTFEVVDVQHDARPLRLVRLCPGEDGAWSGAEVRHIHLLTGARRSPAPEMGREPNLPPDVGSRGIRRPVG